MAFLATVAWRNLWRHGRRSLITAVGMAVGIALCMALFCFDDGISAIMFEVMVERSLGHAQVHQPDYPRTRALFDAMPDGDAVLAKIEALPETRAAAPRLFGFALIGGAEVSAGGLLTGVDPVREATVSPLPTRIVAGRWLSDAPQHEVVLGAKLAAQIGAALGDQVVVVTQSADGSTGNDLYTVVGTYLTGSSQADKAGAVLHLADLRALLVMEGKLHEISLLARDEDGIAAYATAVKAATGDDGVLVQTWWESAPNIAQMLQIRDSASFVLLGIVFSVAALGVLNTMTMSVLERTHELGVLQALGLRPFRLVLLVLTESVFLAGLACAIGLALGGLLDLYLVRTGIDFSASLGSVDFGGISLPPVIHGVVKPSGIAWTSGAVFFVSLVASLGPAFRAARMRPVEALRQE